MIVDNDRIAGLDRPALEAFVAAVLTEDLGVGGDVTTLLTIAADVQLTGTINARQDVVLAGIGLAEAFFVALDPQARVTKSAAEGDTVSAGAPIMKIEGAARAMLSAERSALNTLQHLTGIATLTRQYADEIIGTGCTLLDTRKTLPGLRAIEKYAAKVGGAVNHRLRLDDGILIKDNHVALCGGVAQAVAAAKAKGPTMPVQVEVDNLEQIGPALDAGADRLLCDNMSPDMLRAAVVLVARRVPIEASGGIRLETIGEIARCGVDFVSVGRITQSAPAADIGLDYTCST